jgi:hypothetical protein
MGGFECTIGEAAAENELVFNAYHGGHRMGLGVLPVGAEVQRGAVLTLQTKPTSAIFLVRPDEVEAEEIAVATLDELDARHNRRRVRIPVALVLQITGPDCIIICPGGTRTVVLKGGGGQSFEQWMLVCELDVLVTVTVGAVISLEFIAAVVLQRDAILANCNWPTRTQLIAEVGVYTFPVDTNQPFRLSVSPRCKGLIWRCAASHFNACAGVTGCKSCGGEQLMPEYDCVLYAKGRGFGEFVRLGVSEAFAVQLLSNDHTKYVQPDGTVDLVKITTELTAKLSHWKTLLVRRGYPDSVGKRTNATHQIVTAK